MQKKFSYPLTVADLPQAEQHYRLRAEEADCRYLAEVLQLPAVNRLEARPSAEKQPRGRHA